MIKYTFPLSEFRTFITARVTMHAYMSNNVLSDVLFETVQSPSDQEIAD